MKKFILLIVFLFLLTFTYSFKPVFYNVFYLHNIVFSDINYSVYCLKVDNSLKNNNQITLIDNGNSFIVKSSINNAKFIKRNSSNFLGESVSFKTSFSCIDKILKLYNISVKFTENVGNIFTYYGYSDDVNFYQNVLIDSEIINVEIAFCNNVLTIGMPIILGDY